MYNDEMKNLLRSCANSDIRVAAQANREIAQMLEKSMWADIKGRFDLKNVRKNSTKALELPVRQGVLKGDIISDIFEMVQFEPGVNPEWPLDLVTPGTEGEFVAYTMPSHGKIPQRHVEGDYVMVPPYPVFSSIDYNLDYARDARWDIVKRAKEALDASLVRKLNNDGWRVIINGAFDRNVVVFDSDAAAGQFTKRLVSLMKTEMRRRGGGNSTSLNRVKLTDLYVSPEAIEDMRNWGVDQLDEISRREIYVADDGTINRIFMVNLHDLDELGVSQEYQLYFTSVLGGSLGSDSELIIGLDLQSNNSFVMPVREQWQVFEDMTLHREWRQGWYGRMTVGFGLLDNRSVLAGSF